ncbi:hypothetical protein F5B19DRAFT_480716, partial [Rostrohypoxylon terebratum]
MSGRVTKSSQKVSKPRLNQREVRDNRASRIELFGTRCLPCSNCLSFGEESCYTFAGVLSCNHCTRRQRLSCDVLAMNTLSSLSSEFERLQRERREAEDELIRLQQEVSGKHDEFLKLQQDISGKQGEILQRLSKLQRLRRQEEIVRGKVGDILRAEEEIDREEEEE